MSGWPRRVLLLGALVLIAGYIALIGTGQVRAPWASEPNLELLARMNSGVFLDTREGSRNANRIDESLPEQAPLENIALFPEDTAWWTARCQGFFAALFRAELAAARMQALRDEPRLFPFLETLPEGMGLPDSSNEMAMDQMRRYERSFPFQPSGIMGDALYQTDLPICLDVAQGVFPKRP